MGNPSVEKLRQTKENQRTEGQATPDQLILIVSISFVATQRVLSSKLPSYSKQMALGDDHPDRGERPLPFMWRITTRNM
jgi:hypothetical protein